MKDEISTYVIYVITNKTNNKKYIGQTKQTPPVKRFSAHKRIARLGKEKCPNQFRLLHSMINVHGEDNFSFEVIDSCIGLTESNILEKFYIELYKTNVNIYKAEYGYNMTAGGDGTAGHSQSKETRDKISKNMKGKRAGKLHHNYGKHLTKEHKDKIAAKSRGRKHTEASKEKLRIANSGVNNPMYGKHLTPEQRKKISIRMKGENNPFWNKPTPKYVREKQSSSQRRLRINIKFNHTQETIDKIKNARKNQDMTYRIAKEIKEEIFILFDTSQLTKRQLAEKFNLKIRTIRTIVRRYGKPITIRKKNISKDQLIKSMEEKLTIEEIAKKFNCRRGVILDRIKEFEIVIEITKPIPPKRVKIIDKINQSIKDEIIALFVSKKMTREKLCEEYGYSFPTIENILEPVRKPYKKLDNEVVNDILYLFNHSKIKREKLAEKHKVKLGIIKRVLRSGREIVSLFNTGKINRQQIKDNYKLEDATIDAIFNNSNNYKSFPRGRKYNIIKEDLIKCINEKMTIEQIAEKYECSAGSISNRIKEYDLLRFSTKQK